MATNLWIFAATSWIVFVGFTLNATSYLKTHPACQTLSDRNFTEHDRPNRRLGSMPNTFTHETLLSAVFLTIALVSSLAAISL